MKPYSNRPFRFCLSALIAIFSAFTTLSAQVDESLQFRSNTITVLYQDKDSLALLNTHMNWGDTKSNTSNGYLTTTWGRNNLASENQATAWGIDNEATSWNSTAFGNSTKAIASHATSWGAFTEASGIYSTASGFNTKVNGDYSMGWGNGNIVSGPVSTGWGVGNTISGGGGAVWGFSNNVSGQVSTSWGRNNTIAGDTSTVWGTNNQVGGKLASVWGKANSNQGFLGTSWGMDNVNASYLSTSFGRRSVNREGTPDTWKDGEPLLQIGNGDEDERNDALVILKDGNVGINFGNNIPKEKLEVMGNIKSSANVSAQSLLASSKVGVGTITPAEQLEVFTTSDTSHVKIVSTGNTSILDLDGIASSAFRMFQSGDEVAQFRWSGSNLEIYSQPPTTFPVLRYPALKMTPNNKVGINKGLFTPVETLEVGGRIKVGFSTEQASAGVMRYNSNTESFEGYNGSNWEDFTGLPQDEDGDSFLSFKESNTDSIVFTVNANETMSFNGHALALGKNGNTIIGNGATQTDYNSNNENTSIGAESTPFMFGGISNTNIGFQSGYGLTTGDFNVYLGARSARLNQNGSENTMLGYEAGLRSTGSGNVFLGHQAGFDEMGDDKLYIDNSRTGLPLIYGDFAQDEVKVNGSFHVPSLGNGSNNQNLVVSPDGEIIADNKASFSFHSADFSDWLNQLGGVNHACSINNDIRNGAIINRILVKAVRFNPVQPTMNVKLMARDLETGVYNTLATLSVSSLPTVPELYLYNLGSPLVIDTTRFEYLLTSQYGPTQIISVILL